MKFVTNRWNRPKLDLELLSVRHTFAENIASNWPTRSGSIQMDYWDQPLTCVITPKSGPLPQMSSLLDANRALTGKLPHGFLKRPHWLKAGQALMTAAETGASSDIDRAFETIVIALDEEGWSSGDISPASPSLPTNPPDLGTVESGEVEWVSETIVTALEEEGYMTQVISPTEPPLSLSANPTNICASVDANVGTRRTEEPLWRRILPNSISFVKGR